jgi:hypothetical protein
VLSLSLAILLASAPRDGLAPLQPGVAQAGTRFDLVLRPQGDGCRFLLSDAETDAPVTGAKLGLQRFGKAGTKAVDETAAAGRYDGHYLADCGGAGEALVVNAAAAGGADLFTFTMPAAPPAPAKPPKTASIPVLAGIVLLLAAWTLRRHRGTRAALMGLCLLSAGDAAAHGADEAGLPIAPGSELGLGQEIQFALGLRTARVTVASFEPPAELGPAAPRTSPSVPRSAVVERDGKKLVFVRLAPERFVAREVTLGWSSGAYVAVEAGLQPGELAVVSGGAFLRNGGASSASTPQGGPDHERGSAAASDLPGAGATSSARPGAGATR